MALEVFNKVMPKIELVLEKLDKMEKKLDNLESYVKVVEGKVNRLEEKVERFESFSKDATSSIKVLDEGMSFANSEIENMKEKMKHWERSLQSNTARVQRKLQGEIETLRDEKLYIEVYQRRENLRFYGIGEASGATEKNVKQVLVGFMQNELDISEADTIEFQRIQRIGRLNPSQDKPRPIIARFLRYSDRELVMSRAKKLKEKGLGISAPIKPRKFGYDVSVRPSERASERPNRIGGRGRGVSRYSSRSPIWETKECDLSLAGFC